MDWVDDEGRWWADEVLEESFLPTGNDDSASADVGTFTGCTKRPRRDDNTSFPSTAIPAWSRPMLTLELEAPRRRISAGNRS